MPRKRIIRLGNPETQMAVRRQNGGMAVRMICALALLCLGLAHRMPVLEAADQPLSLAYRLPDGSAPALCMAEGSRQAKRVEPDCDACRLASATILPEPPCFEIYSWAREAVATPSFGGQPSAGQLARAQTARGPPRMHSQNA